MRKTISTKPADNGAVLVSRNLQRLFFIAVAAGLVIELLYFAAMFAANSMQYAVQTFSILAAFVLLPAALFILAYVFGPQYSNRMQRSFIAALKSTIGMALYGILQSTWNQITMLYMGQFHQNGNGMPPAWVMSNWPMAVSAVMVLVLFGAFLFAGRRKRSGR